VFGITPKPFDAVIRVSDLAAAHECLGVVNSIMFPIPLQGLITTKECKNTWRGRESCRRENRVVIRLYPQGSSLKSIARVS